KLHAAGPNSNVGKPLNIKRAPIGLGAVNAEATADKAQPRRDRRVAAAPVAVAQLNETAQAKVEAATAPVSEVRATELPDLELLSVSLLDGGSDEELIGPKFRVMIRNNTMVAVTDEFAVTLSAANDDRLTDDLPWNTKWVQGIEAGKTLAVDI